MNGPPTFAGRVIQISIEVGFTGANKNNSLYFMREALKEAQKALGKNEVPVGAVVVYNDKIIGRGHNQSITSKNPCAHAEIIALEKAARKLKSYRLNDTKIYVTVEPCAMCAGALVWARVSHIYYGAKDPKAGACGSILNVVNHKKLNHRIKITAGVLENDCRSIIQEFFQRKRKKHGGVVSGSLVRRIRNPR